MNIRPATNQEINFYDTLIEMGVLEKTDLDIVIPGSFDPELMAKYFRSEPIGATDFTRNREKFRDQLQGIVSHLWKKHNLPKDGIVEYGSGSTGYFFSKLRPNDCGNWLQVEINPTAIENNKKLNPNAQVIEGSYYDIPFRNVPLVCGLSSFDTAQFMDEAMKQVATALQPGGYFVHIQDVRPGTGCVTGYLQNKGKVIPRVAYTAPGDGNIFFSFVTDGKIIPSHELFRESIEDGINSQPDLRLVSNTYLTAENPIPGETTNHYLFNSHLALKSSPAYKKATTLVTIAQKI